MPAPLETGCSPPVVSNGVIFTFKNKDFVVLFNSVKHFRAFLIDYMNEKENIIERPPVVVVMGHIDHGKSTLLDYIRKSNIVESEAGGITQRISAYEVIHTLRRGPRLSSAECPQGKKVEKKITFLDTPGHEAFSAMRSRGANVADVAILVISAEDGVRAQTIEAYNAIKKTKTPFVIAINKTDKPEANVEKTISDLIENGIYLEGYGGDIPYSKISAKTGDGMNELLDVILLVAELEELKGDVSAPGEGFVMETHIDPKCGVSATLVIKNGKIEKGMFVSAGDSFSPVRMMENFLGEKIDKAFFSSPVKITGFNKAPAVGTEFKTHTTKKEAELAMCESKEIFCKKSENGGLDGNEEKLIIPIVIKADALGSIEAIEFEVGKIVNEKICLKVVQKGIGAINEADIKPLGTNKEAIALGFNVSVNEEARQLAEKYRIKIATFNIIYELSEWLKKDIEEKTPKSNIEKITGRAKIIRVFSKTKDRQIVGGKVLEGIISTGENVKIIRNAEEIGRGKIIELQQQRVEIKEIKDSGEVGIRLESKITISVGDMLEVFTFVEE